MAWKTDSQTGYEYFKQEKGDVMCAVAFCEYPAEFTCDCGAMVCEEHTDKCDRCGKRFCSACLTGVDGELLCNGCREANSKGE